MKVAIVHDYLVNRGGAERVVLAFHRIFPEAPIFTALYDPDATYPAFREADVRPSGLQRFVTKSESFRHAAPFFPRVFRRMQLRGYDVVLSSSSGFAHHVRPDGCHIVYCYTPPRFLWDRRYDGAAVAPPVARPLVPLVVSALRRSDRRAATRPHFYIAISNPVAERIRALYGREATVIHASVEVDNFSIAPNTRDEFLMVSRLLPYKLIDVAIRAFNELGRTLIIVGDGPARPALERIAGPTIQFRGVVSDEELRLLYGRSRAAVVVAEEDYGLVPLEANASGRPVIAFRAGGVLETVVEGVTGVTFTPAIPQALAQAVRRVDDMAFDPAKLRAHAETFSEQVFGARIREFVERSTGVCMACARARRARPHRLDFSGRQPILRETQAKEA